MLAIPLLVAAALSTAPQVPPAFEALPRETFVARSARGNYLITRDQIAGITFIGARVDAKVAAQEPLAHKANYFIGDDPQQWRTDVRQFARLSVRGVWDGIDIDYYWREDELEFDFIVAPAANVSQIRFHRPAATPRLGAEGALEIGELRLRRPQARQSDGQAVAADFIVDGDVVSLRIGRRDPAQTLVIDPVVSYSTYFGGTSSETPFAMTVDGAGNIYVAGSTYSTDFPLQSPFQEFNRSNGERDAFIAKFDPSGSRLIFSTYLGGARGREIANAIALGSDGSVYMAGDTHSVDFPTTAGAFQRQANPRAGDDGFVARISPDGTSLIYSTYLAANSTGASFEILRGIAVDGAGNAYIVGDTSDASMPTTQGAYRPAGCDGDDAFVIGLNPGGTALLFGTYLCGGSFDRGYAIAVDRVGDLYVAGSSSGANFEAGKTEGTFRGAADTYVAKLDGRGTRLIYSRFLGGSESDLPSAIKVDDDGNAYVGGSTRSPDFPAAGGFQVRYGGSPLTCGGALLCGDGFVAKLNAMGAVTWATYIGGSNADDLRGMAIDSTRRVAVAGVTASRDFPRVAPIQSNALNGLRDGWFALLSADGRSVLFSTTIGGASFEHAAAVAFDASGALYVAGETSSTDFPVSNAFQPSKRTVRDEADIWLMKITGAGVATPKRRGVRR